MKKKYICIGVLAALLSFGGHAEAGSLKGESTAASVKKVVRTVSSAKVSISPGKKKTAAKTVVKKAAAAKKTDTAKTAKKADTAKTAVKKTESTKTAKTVPVGKGGPTIEVGLLSGQKEASVKLLADCTAEADGKTWQTFKRGETLSVSRSGKSIVIGGKKKEGPVYLRASGSAAAFSVKGNTYRGDMKLIPSAYSDGVTVVNAVSMEEYLCGVVPSEVSPSWHTDALRAQAVAARTYAMYHRDGYRNAGYDVTDDTRSQVYRGTSVEAAATDQAIKDTAGEVITYDGKPIDAVFHSNGGGYTENSENVWGSRVPYLRGVAEESSSVLDKAWTKTVTTDAFGKAAGVGTLKSIELSKLKKGQTKAKDRGISGRVISVKVTGSKGTKTLTGDDVQSAFGLSSTLFDISVKGKNVNITGYGAGHGLGLSQWGAEAMAAKKGNGKDYYKTILTHYFTGTKIEKIY